jgi:uncharacterized protein
MRRVFLDTSYLVASIDPKDDQHKRAKVVSKELGNFTSVTSEMVLAEFLNYFSAQGKSFRKMSIDVTDSLRSDPSIEIIPQTSQQFELARQYYRQRLDKGYSLTDCASMLIMKEQGIQDALTHDRHFEQEGFCALLRNN